MRPLILGLAILLPAAASAVPMQFHHQGRLLSALGQPLDAPEDVVFRLYDAPAGGTPLWEETHAATDFSNGYYAVELGGSTSLDPSTFDADDLYVSVQVGSGAELPNRLPLLSVPFAVRANSSDALNPGAVVDASEIRINGTTVIDTSGQVDSGAMAANGYTDAMAVAAVDTADAYVRNSGDDLVGGLGVDTLTASGAVSADSLAASNEVSAATATLSGGLTAGSASLTGDMAAANATLSGSLAASSGSFSGDISAANATLSGNLGAAGATLSGDLGAANATLSGDLGAANATLSGDLGAANATLSGDLGAANATLSGNLGAAGATLSGDLGAANATLSGDLGAATAAISGAATAGSLLSNATLRALGLSTLEDGISTGHAGGDSGGPTSDPSYLFGYQEAGAWSHPYPDLVMGYHTGVKIGGHYSYNGTRFYNDHPGRSGASRIASIGDGDNNTRVYGQTIAYGGIQTGYAGSDSNIGHESYKFGYQEDGPWTHPYPDLILGYHTGIKIGGHSSYDGTRFYNDHPGRSGAAMIFSVGDGDNNVRSYGYLSLSSREYKQNIEYLDGETEAEILDTLLALRPATYEYRPGTGGYSEAKPERLGFIAEEMPEAVLSGDGKSIDNYALITYTISAVQALAADKAELQQRNDDLEARLLRLEQALLDQ